LRLRVEVGAAPSPYLLRSAIERRLAGRAVAEAAERAVADAVVEAVRARLETEGPWR